MEQPVMIQMIHRKVDGNGNVPRLWLVYDNSGMVVDIADGNYGNIPRPYRGLTELPRMMLTPAEFREWERLRTHRRERERLTEKS